VNDLYTFKAMKKVILISEREENYPVLKRAINIVGNISVYTFTEDSLKDKNGVVLLAATDEDKFQGLFYEAIRSRYLNPVIVLGFREEVVFKKKHPLFDDHPYNHSYIRIPFDLSGLIVAFENMSPISSQAIRKAICGGDTGYKGYLLKLLSHDLLKDRERCVEILTMSGDYLNDENLSKEIKDAEKKIKEEKDWSAVASDIGKKLENKIKEAYHV